ncbi:hypothetical protein ASE86_04805 [Sphingomonas sp. Leaf33]|uniref:hypothetical protein n=1 Tax=Sphingomonas sp. Leaf33 TaxID=1736215 RepID=UPI0006FC8FB6|nr:hypothetical protein [Sphingomonas sp. Leaf33]KQN25548.1 hypothetical protein ASE86_04805 [Sphingomonas sp. Leaf33]
MKTIAPIALALTGLLAACSSQPVNETPANIAAENTVEEVMPSEGAATEEQAADIADANANSATPDAAGPADAARMERDYLGKWTGVEGMSLNVAAKPGGGVTMDMRWGLDDDMAGKIDGSVTAEGLRFMRGGVAETAVFTDGDATGLKWLAGKKTCLTVKPGEGYCRG